MGRIVNICPLRVLQRRGPAKRAHGGYKRCDQQHLGFIQTPELPPPDMKLFLLLLCLTGLTLSSCNLLQFSSMIKRKTGKSALSYNGYGCYCGLRGSKQPLDATDWCCHAHDCCYKRLASSSCSPKWVKYNYSTRGNQIVCESGTWCQRQTCDCDRKAAECFGRTVGTYRNAYKNYPNILCRGSTPPC
ncbi:group IIE secretory phospholipase A2-like isoform X2 [Strix aluco]|uniref:group IIE secretory phospholipase A2-like isoform X2 n=1 Tax=Strix aluco TaxID=111821 RepID=UPI003DA4F5A3